MQIFGQVWLWSLGSFLLGVLFTWLLLVRPMRRRVNELEDVSVSAPPRELQQPTRVAEPAGPPTGKEADRFLDDLFSTGKQPSPQPQHHPVPVPPQPIRPPQLPPAPMPTSAQPGPTAPPELPPLPPLPESVVSQLAPKAQQAFASRLDPQAPPEPPIPDESDTELSDNSFQHFAESTTVFVPPADLRMPDKGEASGEDWFAKEDDPDPHLITDVEDDERVDEQGTIFTQHTTPIPDEMIRSLDESPSQQEPRHYEPEPVQQYESPLAEHIETPKLPDPVQHYEAPEPVQHYEPPLPEHIETPKLPDPVQHYEEPRHYEPEPVQQYDPPLPEYIETPKLPDPEPVEPVEPGPTQRFEPVANPAEQDQEHDSSRSLFEPVVPVAEQHEDDAADGFVPPGPFGPGSAMPLPGGGAPAPEFSVKASVTALRYCTQDNPQFDRIVAEVWFRSPGDAERVGFRVLS